MSAGLIAREGACEQNLVRVAVTDQFTARAFEGDWRGPFNVANGDTGRARTRRLFDGPVEFGSKARIPWVLPVDMPTRFKVKQNTCATVVCSAGQQQTRAHMGMGRVVGRGCTHR